MSRSTASTGPVLPTRSESICVTEPAPAPTSRHRQPSPTPIAFSWQMVSGSWNSCSSLRRDRSRSGEPCCERRYSVTPGRDDSLRKSWNGQLGRIRDAGAEPSGTPALAWTGRSGQFWRLENGQFKTALARRHGEAQALAVARCDRSHGRAGSPQRGGPGWTTPRTRSRHRCEARCAPRRS